MNDLRGIPRGSKAAVVVVLVVLLQVIVLAVVGLGAIARDREAGERGLREEERRRAEATATATLDRMREGLGRAVSAAATAALTARDPGGERALAPGEWSRAFRSSFRVDVRGRVRSFGGTLLYVPLETVGDDLRRTDHDRRRALEQRERVEADPTEARREYARSFPFHVDAEDYPVAAAHAHWLAERAVEAAVGKDAGGPEAIAAAQAVLHAFEAVAANQGRSLAPRTERVLSFLAASLDGLAGRVPGSSGEALVQGLADLRRARADFEEIRARVLEEASAAARSAAPPRVFALPWGDDVVAVASVPVVEGAPREALVVRVDRRILASIAEEEGVPASNREVGFSTRVVPRTEPAARGDVLRRTLYAPPDFDTGLDVAVVRSGPPGVERAIGPREVFYWSILGLATLGLATSGLVLLRVFRREVRLARLKADFVSNLSHELKTPLTSIALFVEMVRDGRAAEGPELKEAMDVIAQESERLQRLVARMIDVARREAAPTDVALAPGDLNEPVRAACERFRRLERSSALHLAVDLAPGLPPVRLDPAALDDVVTNLLSNAWKYRRGDEAHVRVSTRVRGRRVELAVEDDGIGIPRHERRRVFEMFYRAEAYLSRGVPGTGLGLALVRTIVRAHRGKVRIEASPSGGTTVRVRLPVARGHVATTAARPRPAPAAPPAKATPGAVR
jgi:signal transduction histidine kinase